MAASAPDPTRELLPEGPLRMLAELGWQLVLLAGLASLALGVVVLSWPHATLLVVGVLFGSYLLVSGIFQVMTAFATHAFTALRVMAFISGTLSILLGLVCFRGAAQSLLLLAFWIGIGWLFRGVMLLAAAFSDPRMPGRGWHIFAGLVSLAGGVVVIDSPFSTLSVLTVYTGIWLVVMGLVETAAALKLRRA